MPQFFIVLLKINLVLVLFAAAYYLILRQLTFYVINRAFLVFGILFATVYPFIDLTKFFEQQNKIVAFIPQVNQVNALVKPSIIADYWQWISLLFYTGVCLMAVRLIIQFVSLYQMHRKSVPGKVNQMKVRILQDAVGPFSFWRTVYVNPTLHQPNELQTILAHEQIHVKQWHSLDIILAELSVVFYWFNPGVWLMKKAVKENLEFITDEKILKQGVDRKMYQYSLLDVGALQPVAAIVNNFNLSDLKKRIKMMNVKRSSKLTLSRYMLVLPVLLMITLAFTVSKKQVIKQFSPIKKVFVSLSKADDNIEKISKITNKKIKKKTILSAITPKDTSKKLNVFINTIVASSDSVAKKVAEVIVLRKAEMARSASNGTPKNNFVFIHTTDSAKLPSNTVKGIIAFKTEFDNFTGTTTAKQVSGKMDKITITGVGKMVTDTASASKSVVYYFNGKKVDVEDIKRINADDIASVNVLKTNTPTKAEIHITTKQN